MGQAVLRHGNLVHTFRCAPNAINWTYKLNTHIDNTYGGRVVQVLSAYIDDLTVQADAGWGGWEYVNSLALFCRDFMFQQAQTGQPGTFSFPQRGWEMKVYMHSIPFSDFRDNVKKSYTLKMKVQEDVSGVMSGDTVSAELSKIRDGIGYERNQYNYPQTGEEENPSDGGSATYGGTTPDALDASGIINGNRVTNILDDANGTRQSSALQSTPDGFLGGGRSDWTGPIPPPKSKVLQTVDHINAITGILGQANALIGTVYGFQTRINNIGR